jgi:hypothetical protein
MILPRLGISGAEGGCWGALSPPAGGPCVTLAGPDGLVTAILTASRRTPSTSWTAVRAWRTRVAGSSGASRKVKLTPPSGVTVRSRIMPLDSRSFSNRGF